MPMYYAYCENHGPVSPLLPSVRDAKDALNNHLLNDNTPHGIVKIIEEYVIEKYGRQETRLRIITSYSR